jgi:peptidoglycan/LPS O-acetylase OafA/YrhL
MSRSYNPRGLADRSIFGGPEQSKAQPHPNGFRPDIEGLRAIAILLVVGYHAALPGFSGGYVGVDVFFVLSGYLITGLLVGEIEDTGTINLRRFYARRARRLLPALTITLLFTIIAGFVVYPPSEVIESGLASTAVSTAAYASNLYFAKSGEDYFGPDREKNPLLHTWSLSVEEQFYLIWPVFILFAFGALASFTRKNEGRRRLLWCLAIAVALSFAISLVLTERRRSWAYFASPARAWEFGLGGFVALFPQQASAWSGGEGLLDRCRMAPSVV